VKFRALGLAALAMLLFVSSASAAPFNTIRIAAYYPWFPEGWTYAEMNPFTHFQPSLGFYDAGSPNVVERQIRAMQYGRITAATYSWWGQGSPTDRRFDTHLASGARLGFKWAIYHELEGYGDPTVEEIRSDLEYIRDNYAASPGYLKLGGRPVVFVYGDADDGCELRRGDALGAGERDRRRLPRHALLPWLPQLRRRPSTDGIRTPRTSTSSTSSRSRTPSRRGSSSRRTTSRPGGGASSRGGAAFTGWRTRRRSSSS
jgi:hypothetical protein